MTQHSNAEHEEERPKRRRRSRPFPSMNFEQSLVLPKAIMEHSVGGEIRRLTLFGKLGRSPTSGPGRELVTSSSKYGLTSGSYKAPSLSITDKGRMALSVDESPREAIEMQFQLAIGQIEPFNNLYEKLKDQRIPTDEVLGDELVNVGVDDSDRSKATEIFTANLRFLDLIHDISGNAYVRTIEQVLEEKPEKSTSATEGSPKSHGTDAPDTPVEPAEDTRKATPRPNLPELHVDIQIHIDSTASSEQIDQIFASMARHLYGRDSN